MPNIILSIDTSIDYCSISIYKNKFISSIITKCKETHTKKVLPMIQEILFKTQTKFKDINCIAFAKGPGSFTGIRIAASIAQSFSISLNIPIIHISTLAIMAEQAWRKYNKKKVIVAIKAQKNKIYWAKYRRNKKSVWISENTESLLNEELIENEINNLKTTWTLVGNGWNKIEDKNFLKINKTNILYPDAQDIIPFVLLIIQNSQLTSCVKENINYLYNDF